MALGIAIALAFLVLPEEWRIPVIALGAAIELAEVGFWVWWNRRRQVAVGVETLVGRTAVAVTHVGPRGQVRIDGEIWEAESGVHVEPGVQVVVRAVDGLTLRVEPA